jgi:sugar O-acyltransferase (sialic acid O-acetyltransferase NeuD family)
MNKAIIGAGGFAKEVYWSLSELERKNCVFFVNENFWVKNDKKIFPISSFNPNEYEVVIAVGNPLARFNLLQTLPASTKFFTHIHPSSQILGDDVSIGEGSIICAGSIITTNVTIGKHCHLNLQTTIGHDCIIGDFFTTAPGVRVSGNCLIKDFVYLGTNTTVKEKITIYDSVTIGLNSGIVKDITEPGTYVGTPSFKIK